MDLSFELKEIGDAAKKFLPFIFNQSKVIALNGVMGAGKTTFIHEVCRQMGVTDKMNSPTYSIINQYKTISGKIINHIDVYRIKDVDEAIQAGVEDSIARGDFCFIEWPEKIKDILPLDTADFLLKIVSQTKRKLTRNLPANVILNS